LSVVVTARDRIDRANVWLLAVATAWGVGLILAALLVPAYSSTTTTSSGHFVSSSASLVQQNGPRVLLPVSAPLVAVGIVGALLVHRRRAALPGAGIASWVVVAVLGVVSVLGILTIGPFILPVTALLLAVCSRSP
jgi:hypothetical protein